MWPGLQCTSWSVSTPSAYKVPEGLLRCEFRHPLLPLPLLVSSQDPGSSSLEEKQTLGGDGG